MAALVRKCADKTRLFQVALPRLYSASSSGNNTGSSSSETKSQTKAEKPKAKAAAEPKTVTPDPELSDNTKYRSAEYYSYNDMSFYDIDHEMASFRLPQQTKFKEGSS